MQTNVEIAMINSMSWSVAFGLSFVAVCPLLFALCPLPDQILIFKIFLTMSMPVTCMNMAAAISQWPRWSFQSTLMYSGFITVTATATKIGKPQSNQADIRELVVKVFR